MRIIITLNNKVVSLRSPEGNNNILDINAAKVEYAKQLNHLYIRDFSLIFSDVNTPKNLDIYVASDVINITKIILVVIYFSNKKCNSPSGFENQYPNQLSGGMQQRVGLARALATDTDIMLMDEAFSALDPLIRSDMQKQLLDLQSQLKKTIVFITHDLDESLRLGDHIGILNAGKLVQVGTPVEIVMNPADDYVEAFVKDVNRAKVLKAKIIMKSANEVNGIDKNNLIKVGEDQFIEEFLPQVVCTNANCEVVDKQGNIKGYITNKELQKSLTRS